MCREVLALPDVRRWREAGEAYKAAVSRLGVCPSAPQLDVAALMCHVLERAILSAIQPRCPTCDAPYTLAGGCTNVRCSACGHHHCHICSRRFVHSRQPVDITQLRSELYLLAVAHGTRARDEEQASVPMALRTCPLDHPLAAAEMFALHPTWDAVLQAPIEPWMEQHLDTDDRFMHSGEHIEDCILYVPGDEQDRRMSSMLTEVPPNQRLAGLPFNVYVQLGQRCGAAEGSEEMTGVALAYRLSMKLRSIAKLLPRALASEEEETHRRIPEVLRAGLRWAFPIMMHAAGQWSAGKSSQELATAPLTPLCLLWLLGLPLRTPSHSSPVLPPMPTLLLRLMYSVGVLTNFIQPFGDLDDEQEDDDGASRFVEAEAIITSMVEAREAPSFVQGCYLYTRIGLLDMQVR